MKKRLEWLALFLLAVFACGIAVREAPEREPFPPGQAIPGAASVEKQAEDGALAFGWDLRSWRRFIQTRRNGNLRVTFEQNLVESRWQLRNPAGYVVRFFGQGGERCMVEVDLRGSVVALDCRNGSPSTETFSGTPSHADGAREAAMRAYASLWGRGGFPGVETDFGFRLTTDAALEPEGYAFEWTSQPDNSGKLAWKLSFLVREGNVAGYQLSPLPLEPLVALERERNRSFELMLLVLLIAGLVAICAAPVVMILNLYRGRLPGSFVMRAAALLAFLLALDFAVGERYSTIQLALRGEIADVVRAVIGSIVGSAVALAVMAAGRATRVSTDFRRWLGLEDFLRLRWNKASVTRSFMAGSLVSMLWLGIPYAVLAFSVSGLAEGLSRQATVLRFPPIGGIYTGRSLAILAVVLFIFPLIKARVKNRRMQAVLALGAGAMGSAYTPLVEYPFPLLALEALLHGFLLVYAYHRHGVLAALLGVILAAPLGRAFVFFERGEMEPQAWGLGMLVAAGLFFGVCLLLDLRNPNREEEQRLSEEEFEALKRESERRVVTRRERLLGEFALAEQAQRRMLPSHPPSIPGLEVAAVCRPAQQVGGDLFDYLRLSDARWAFCVADVSGKGVSAALYMTMVKGLLSSVQRARADLPEIVSTLNRHIHRCTGRRDFVTMMLAAIDPSARKLEVLRAGHPPLLHVSADGQTRFADPPGMGLGMVVGEIFRKRLGTATIRLQPGDVAVLYSDGVTEAMNRQREEFGEQRLARMVRDAVAESAEEILQRVQRGIHDFQEGAPVHDDITLMVLKAVAVEQVETATALPGEESQSGLG